MLFEGLHFTVSGGEALELRGPNGSGKSTLLRILAGLTQQAEGKVNLTVAGEGSGAPEPRDASRHYLGHADAIKPAESAREQARFWARFFGRDDAVADAAMARLGIASRRDVPGRGLSAGQRRRLALCRLLIDPRPVWLLDEPAASLDAGGRALLDQLVAEHLAGGGLVIAAVHGQGFPNSRPLDLTTASPKG